MQITRSGELGRLKPDVFVLDQLSAGVPLLRYLWPRSRILFYCHFPDKLLAVRAGWVKRVYRVPFDWLEEWSTGAADGLVVNSRFTREVFAKSFVRLAGRQPGVVYPCVDTKVETGDEKDGRERLWGGKKILLSINRFERKKGVELALKAFAALNENERRDARLVVAGKGTLYFLSSRTDLTLVACLPGGYDPRVQENVVYHKELVRLADSMQLRNATTKTIVTALSVPDDIQVLFLLSVPASLKTTLLRTARLLLYTPPNEHFGIVPLEAMHSGVPVLAANTGGPLETVIDGRTGWLRSVDDVDAWAKVISSVLHDMVEADLNRMRENGRRRVRQEFSREKMAERFDEEMDKIMMIQSRRHPISFLTLGILGFGMAALGALLAWGAWRIRTRLRAEKARTELHDL